MTGALCDYLREASLRDHPLLARLRAETASHPRAIMQITPEQGQFMQLLLRLTGARRTLEIGVFTGYSALITALALPEDGQVVACDISDEWTSLGRPYWHEAGVAHKIDLRLAPALDTLNSLTGPFDFAFIDADKINYDAYYERCLQLPLARRRHQPRQAGRRYPGHPRPQQKAPGRPPHRPLAAPHRRRPYRLPNMSLSADVTRAAGFFRICFSSCATM